MARFACGGLLVVAALTAGACSGDRAPGDASASADDSEAEAASSPVPATSAPMPATSAPMTSGPTTTTGVETTTTPTVTAAAAVGHDFPVRPPSAASYDPSHHDYPAADIFASCGSDVVAVTDGVIDEVVLVDEWSPANDNGATRSGLLVSLVGDDGVRYYGSHLAAVAPGVDAGVRVTRGTHIGSVGDTGNARGSGCHLHFGLSAPCGPGDWERRRGEVWPQPHLDAWRTGTDSAPADEISSRRC